MASVKVIVQRNFPLFVACYTCMHSVQYSTNQSITESVNESIKAYFFVPWVPGVYVGTGELLGKPNTIAGK